MLANGSYIIYYIIGDVQGQTGQEWSRLPGFAGLSHILAAPASVCENCASQEEQAQLVTSTTAITSLLLDYVQIGKLENMEEDSVKKFLINNLKWRAQTVSTPCSNIKLKARMTDSFFPMNKSLVRSLTPGIWTGTTLSTSASVANELQCHAAQVMCSMIRTLRS
jgi:hypothetical protein